MGGARVVAGSVRVRRLHEAPELPLPELVELLVELVALVHLSAAPHFGFAGPLFGFLSEERLIYLE